LSEPAPEIRTEPVRVFVVEDDPRQLKALHRLLETQPGVKLAGTATSGEIALELLSGTAPAPVDVVLMDLELPGYSGIEATRRLRARGLRPEVLVHTSYEDEDHVFEAMRAGASGYVVKGARAAKLAEAILEVDRGGTVIEPRLAKRFWAFFKGVQEPRKAGPALSEIEQSVLFAIAKGLSNAEAGRVIGLDRRTVRTHLGHLYEAFGVRSHVELVVAALQFGMVDL
jgi:DNA-binding NarL/FixJ family response regulator